MIIILVFVYFLFIRYISYVYNRQKKQKKNVKIAISNLKLSWKKNNSKQKSEKKK